MLLLLLLLLSNPIKFVVQCIPIPNVASFPDLHDLILSISNINLMYKRVVNNIQIYLTNFFERFWRSRAVKLRSTERMIDESSNKFARVEHESRGNDEKTSNNDVDDRFNPFDFEYKFNVQIYIINNIQIYLTKF